MPTSVKKTNKLSHKKKKRSLPLKSIITPAKDHSLQPRRLKMPDYKLFRFRHVKHPVRLPTVWRLSWQTLQLLWQNRWVFLEIAIVYGLLNILLVQGLSSSTNVSNLKNQFIHGSNGSFGQITGGFSVFLSLLSSSSGSSSPSAGAYQIFLGLIVSLAIIWALRQIVADQSIRLRDTFYKGMYPLIPFVLVLIVVLLQTLPFLIGGGLYSLVVTNGIAVYTYEKLLWGLLFLILATVSVYMLCSSLFALYIVTLPDMTPMKALRSARKLVQYRRPMVFRKLIFLPVALLVVVGIIMTAVIVLAAPIAPWILFVLAMVGLIVVHAYMYNLYRELLK